MNSALSSEYPYCHLYGLEIKRAFEGIRYIPWSAFDAPLPRAAYDCIMRGLYRQATSIDGPYPWDVEKILKQYSSEVDPIPKETNGTNA